MAAESLKYYIQGYPDGIPISQLSKAAIMDLQGLLIDCGHNLQVDGLCGNKTKTAWADFKRTIYQGRADLIGASSFEALELEAKERKTLVPIDQPQPVNTGALIRLPGITNRVGILQPVYQGSNFTWSEMTKGGSRIPVNATVTERIVKLCKYMDGVRSFLGNRPVKVNSAYRDPVTNRSVGGASQSRHMAGDAVDFYIEGEDVVTTFKKLKGYHLRGGLAVGSGFVHLDLRPGGAVRWRYPGGPNVSLW